MSEACSASSVDEAGVMLGVSRTGGGEISSSTIPVPLERIGGLSPVGNIVELVVSTSMVSGVSSRSRQGVSLLPETSEGSTRSDGHTVRDFNGCKFSLGVKKLLAVIRGSLGSKHSVLASLRTSVGCHGSFMLGL